MEIDLPRGGASKSVGGGGQAAAAVRVRSRVFRLIPYRTIERGSDNI
jgi:hypothetical protein